MSLSFFRFGLRFKLVLLSGFLFAIPWLGWQYVWEMEKFLRQGQESTLNGTVSAVATALHERPRLFEQNASFLSTVRQGRDLYAYHLNEPIWLDGDRDDWANYWQNHIHYGMEYVTQNYQPDLEETVSFNHLVGKYGQYLYAFFEVSDDDVVFRGENSRSINRNDYLEIAFQTRDLQFQRYIIATTRPGWFTAYRIAEEPESVTPIYPETRIQGQWVVTDDGYNIELRIPLDMMGSKIGFAVTDVDDQERKVPMATVGTSGTRDETQLGTVLVPSPEIERIIRGLGHTNSRIWVVDRHQRVLAKAGDIKASRGPWSVRETDIPASRDWLPDMVRRFLSPIYDRLLNRPAPDFIDELEDASLLEGSQVSPVLVSALAGTPDSQWRLTADKRAVILSAAHPIWIEGTVMGAVIAEETTHGIRSLRNRALEKLFNIILLIMGVGTLALFIFASRVSARIRKLRNEAENAIDDQGRITGNIIGSTAGDEIGDLSRSFASIVNRLGQYTDYLENMSSRLSHELRTPIAVVRSSLENLALINSDKEADVFMERANEGLNRLSSLLTAMSEATRMEQFMRGSERVPFDLVDLVESCVEGYRLAYAEYAFDLTTNGPLSIAGIQENIAQLLDKLIANAVEFSQPAAVIEIMLARDANQAVLRVKNRGPCLPDTMKDRIFDAMVSVREHKVSTSPHLGFGLYISRLITDFHHGSISADNTSENDGVVITVKLPLLG